MNRPHDTTDRVTGGLEPRQPKILLTTHAAKDRYVVNTPGTHLQRQPRTYATLSGARQRVEELLREHPGAQVEERVLGDTAPSTRSGRSIAPPPHAAKQLKSETGVPRFDRRVPDDFVTALSRQPMHDLVDLVLSDYGRQHGLDIRLRARPGHSAARATLYLGLTQVLHIHRVGHGRFRLEGQAGKGFTEGLDPTLFRAAWAQPRSEADIAEDWPAVMAYVRAAIGAAPQKFLSSEGLVQARLARGSDRFSPIDREVVVTFPNQGVKTKALAEQAIGIDAAARWLGERYKWAQTRKRFGDELDMLAVDTQGRVLVVEVKHGSDTGGVGWTPAQVALYLRVCQLWADATPEAPAILNGMLDQAADVGIADVAVARVADPLVLVPVIAIGRPIKNAPVANERMRTVAAALAEHDVPLEHLEVWSVDGNDIETVALGEL